MILNKYELFYPTPNAVGWVDVSNYAARGICCQLKPEVVGQYRPVTADKLADVYAGIDRFGGTR